MLTNSKSLNSIIKKDSSESFTKPYGVQVNRRIKMKKMTSLILNGIKAEDEKVFMNRIGELLERNGLLEVFTDGVPVAAHIVDEAEFLNWIKETHPTWNNIDLSKEMEILGNGDIRQYVKYSITRYYTSQEAAKNNEWRERSSKKDEQHQFPGEESDSTSILIDVKTPGIKVVIV